MNIEERKEILVEVVEKLGYINVKVRDHAVVADIPGRPHVEFVGFLPWNSANGATIYVSYKRDYYEYVKGNDRDGYAGRGRINLSLTKGVNKIVKDIERRITKEEIDDLDKLICNRIEGRLESYRVQNEQAYAIAEVLGENVHKQYAHDPMGAKTAGDFSIAYDGDIYLNGKLTLEQALKIAKVLKEG